MFQQRQRTHLPLSHLPHLNVHLMSKLIHRTKSEQVSISENTITILHEVYGLIHQQNSIALKSSQNYENENAKNKKAKKKKVSFSEIRYEKETYSKYEYNRKGYQHHNKKSIFPDVSHQHSSKCDSGDVQCFPEDHLLNLARVTGRKHLSYRYEKSYKHRKELFFARQYEEQLEFRKRLRSYLYDVMNKKVINQRLFKMLDSEDLDVDSIDPEELVIKHDLVLGPDVCYLYQILNENILLENQSSEEDSGVYCGDHEHSSGDDLSAEDFYHNHNDIDQHNVNSGSNTLNIFYPTPLPKNSSITTAQNHRNNSKNPQIHLNLTDSGVITDNFPSPNVSVDLNITSNKVNKSCGGGSLATRIFDRDTIDTSSDSERGNGLSKNEPQKSGTLKSNSCIISNRNLTSMSSGSSDNSIALGPNLRRAHTTNNNDYKSNPLSWDACTKSKRKYKSVKALDKQEFLDLFF